MLCMGSANERRRYIVTSSLIDCAPTQNGLWWIRECADITNLSSAVQMQAQCHYLTALVHQQEQLPEVAHIFSECPWPSVISKTFYWQYDITNNVWLDITNLVTLQDQYLVKVLRGFTFVNEKHWSQIYWVLPLSTRIKACHLSGAKPTYNPMIPGQ